MGATEVRPRVVNDIRNPLRLHPPSPSEHRTSEGRIDSIIDSYAMDRPSSERWGSETSLGSFIDDRCPSEWEQPRSSNSAEHLLSSAWPDARCAGRSIDPHEPTDESRNIAAGVSEEPVTRVPNAVRKSALTALPQSPADESPRPLKTKASDATLLRKLFRATIDEKRKIDEARRQTAQDASARVASKAGAEARSRRAAQHVAPIVDQDQQVLCGIIRQSNDDHAQSVGSEQARSVSESPDSSPSRRLGRKVSFDRTRLLRGGNKNEQESETGVFPCGLGISKGRALSSTREEEHVRTRTRGSADSTDDPTDRPVAREARTKDRESGLEALQRFIRDTGPTDHKSARAVKKKHNKLTKQKSKEGPTMAHHEVRRNRYVAAAAEMLLSPTGEPVSQPPTPQLVFPQPSGNGHYPEAQSVQESRSSKRIADRARWDAEVESARSNGSRKLSATIVERPPVQYSRSVSIDIVRTVPKPPSNQRTSRPISFYQSRPSDLYGGESSHEKEQSDKEFGEIELGWTAPADEAEDLAPASRHSAEQSEDAPKVSPTANFHPASSRGSAKRSTRPPTPKLALKIPKSSTVSVDWEEVSFAQNVVYQTMTPVSASKVTIPKSAGSKSPSIANFEPIAEEFDLEDLERQRNAREPTGSGLTEGAGSDTSVCEKPPIERKDSKSSSDVVRSKDEYEAPSIIRNDSNWFRDWKSDMPQAFEFEGFHSSHVKAKKARRTPQAASPEIQGVVDGWVEDAQESRSLKFAAAKEAMRNSRSDCLLPACVHGDDERSRHAEGPVELRGRSTDCKSITAAGQLRRLPSKKSRSITSKGSAAIGTFDEVDRAAHAGADPQTNAWAAASARSTKVPIRSMSFKPVTHSRATSHASSRALSQAASARSTTFLQHESQDYKSSPGTPSIRTSQGRAQPHGQSVKPGPEHEEQYHSPSTNFSAPVASRPSLHQSRKSQGTPAQSQHSRKSSAASHRPSNAPYPRSVQGGDGGNTADEPPVPPLPESPLRRKNGRHAKPELTIFAGKGWISPHPLSRSSTEHAPSPQSRIILPSEAFPIGATMTYEEWKQMQEDGLRLRHNHSVTESSRTRNGLYQEERFRHAGWEGRESSQTSNWQPNQSHWSERSSRQEDGKASENPDPVAPEAQRSRGSGVSFVTGSAKTSTRADRRRESQAESGGRGRKDLSQQQSSARASGTQSHRGQKLEESRSSRHTGHDGESSSRREHGRRSHRSQRSERTRNSSDSHHTRHSERTRESTGSHHTRHSERTKESSDSHYTRHSDRSGKTVRSSRSKLSEEIEQAWDAAERGDAGRERSEKHSTRSSQNTGSEKNSIQSSRSRRSERNSIRSSQSKRSERIEQAWDDAERGNAGYYVPPQYDIKYETTPPL
ncbi:Dentin sialophosphoprotein [Cercospora zeina]